LSLIVYRKSAYIWLNRNWNLVKFINMDVRVVLSVSNIMYSALFYVRKTLAIPYWKMSRLD